MLTWPIEVSIDFIDLHPPPQLSTRIFRPLQKLIRHWMRDKGMTGTGEEMGRFTALSVIAVNG